MKVTILGAAGGIGQALSLLLKTQLPEGSKLSLYDISPITPGVAVDLSHIPTSVSMQGFTGDNITLALKDTQIVLIAAGFARKPGMDRSDLLQLNARIIEHLIEQVSITSPYAIIGIITNPINTTVPIAAKVLKKFGVYNRKKLFGITMLDIIRSNTLIALLTGKAPEKFNIRVIGGHSGSTILPLFSQASHSNIQLTTEEIHDLTKDIQNAGTIVLESKSGGGSATLSMAYAATHFCLSLVRALKGATNIIECAYVEGPGEYAKFFSQPLMLGKDGISEYCPIGKLSAFEMNALRNMLDQLKYDIQLGEDLVK
ncbi:Malate dehydrogenase [Candidatus Erwinia haradaeae]|uniref:Malate dehydrogenase n=1 Tax=Candidatus Erwinia haradaeae TaxID=1922217 RepID=A0A451DLC2_9GAMM|nr:malate dehydrogenase [Candidatus Erwinia haradaeae]VFP87468.1 Malate dehydrogenase [Candidatus Erwinia haradaeae]